MLNGTTSVAFTWVFAYCYADISGGRKIKKNTGLLIFVQGFVPSGCGEVEV